LRLPLLLAALGTTTLLACSDDAATAPLDTTVRYRLVSISDRALPTVYYQGLGFQARADSGYLRFDTDSMVDWVTYRSVLYPGYEPQEQLGQERVRYRRLGAQFLIARSDTSWDTVTVQGRELVGHFRLEGVHDLGDWHFRP
jgi:hypothetical protein